MMTEAQKKKHNITQLKTLKIVGSEEENTTWRPHNCLKTLERGKSFLLTELEPRPPSYRSLSCPYSATLLPNIEIHILFMGIIS